MSALAREASTAWFGPRRTSRRRPSAGIRSHHGAIAWFWHGHGELLWTLRLCRRWLGRLLRRGLDRGGRAAGGHRQASDLIMAQLLGFGTGTVNFFGRYAYVGAGSGGFYGVVWTEADEPQAAIGSHPISSWRNCLVLARAR